MFLKNVTKNYEVQTLCKALIACFIFLNIAQRSCIFEGQIRKNLKGDENADAMHEKSIKH